MKKKKSYKISIIGGGITGCATALLLARLGHKVTLFEKSRTLGGAIKDIIHNDNFFLNGPNYFDENANWLKEIKKFKIFKKNFTTFKSSYNFNKKKVNIFKSYTDLFDVETKSDLFAQPVTIKKFTGLINFKKTTLLKERLASYQANVSKPIQKWCKNFVENYDNLHESCSSVLNLTRIFFFNDQKLTKKVKKNNKIADKLLGLPIISKKIKYCIPRNGYKVFFTNFEKILKKKIKIKFNSKIRIERGLNKNVKLYENSKLFISDKIIWAGNPIPLMHSLGYRNFTNSLLKIKVYFANIKFTKKYNAQNFYIQVFSKKTNIFRIYIYKFRGQFKITIETFLKNEFINFNKEYLLKILGKFKIYIKILDPLIEHDEIRNILITKSDYYKFLKFEKEYSNSNIIGGGWHLFGTEKKINYIMSKFLD